MFILKALKLTNLSLIDIGVFEINEAFASVVVFLVRKLGLDIGKVGRNGGPIAFGYSLGRTRARQIPTILN